MKFTVFILTLFLFSCNQSRERIVVNDTITYSHEGYLNPDSLANSDTVNRNVVVVEEEVKELILPEGIWLDTLSAYDSALELSIEVILPKSNNQELVRAHKLLYSIILKDRDSFVKEIRELIKNDSSMLEAIGSDYSVTPVELYKTHDVVSYLFMISHYRAGGFHPYTKQYSFNFDTKKQQEIKFSLFFKLKTKGDSTKLLTEINAELQGYYTGINIVQLKEFDYNFDSESITFNFDNYEIESYAAGCPRAKIDRTKILNYIRSGY